jgi:lipopolysaccharide/colanic/teichoic acid biosynthesis glycosyltransferase
MKRVLDIAVSLTGLILASPLLALVALAIWLQDFHSPFYIARRMARGGGTFRMVKFRSMVVNADRTGVNSTAAADKRITPIGRFVRNYKIDEIVQLWNVLKGDMSLVGPRPQVQADADLYTDEERRLLTVRPGITDLASIVFADEGAILGNSANPDLLYNQIIRPWKSRLALLCIDRQSRKLDLQLIGLTAMAIISRDAAIECIELLLAQLKADPLVRRMAARREQLLPYPPPGALKVVMELTPPRPFLCKKFTHPVPKKHNSALEFRHPEAG